MNHKHSKPLDTACGVVINSVIKKRDYVLGKTSSVTTIILYLIKKNTMKSFFNNFECLSRDRHTAGVQHKKESHFGKIENVFYDLLQTKGKRRNMTSMS